MYEKYKISENNLQNLKKHTVYFFLKSLNFSESYISALRKDENSILINNQNATLKSPLQVGDILSITNNPKTKSTEIFEIDKPLDVIFEDDDYLILNKPHNLSCMPSQSHFHDNLGGQIVSYMKKQDPNFVLRIINRLDKDTAGVVVVAKNLLAYKNFSFTKKEYFALCEGIPSNKKFTINKPILTIQKDGINEMKRVISQDGKPAITHIETVKNFDNYTLIKATLETGRTHQIRVHMASENHPLLFDPIYNNSNNNLKLPSDTPAPTHTFLILKNIAFIHFRTKTEVNIEIAFPEEWNSFIR